MVRGKEMRVRPSIGGTNEVRPLTACFFACSKASLRSPIRRVCSHSEAATLTPEAFELFLPGVISPDPLGKTLRDQAAWLPRRGSIAAG